MGDDSAEATRKIIANVTLGNTGPISNTRHEFIDTTSSKIRPLALKAVLEVFSNITSYYSKCHDDVKFVVGAMAIKMKALVLTKKHVLGRDDEFNTGEATSHQLHNWTKSLVKTYQSSFKRKATSVEHGNPVTVFIASRQKKRVKTTIEHAINGKRDRAAANVPTIPGFPFASNQPSNSNCLKVNSNARVNPRVCGFCASRTGHTTTSCPSRKHYQATGKEYDVSKDADADSVQILFAHGWNASSLYDSLDAPIKKLSAEQHRRHMIVHSFHHCSPDQKPNSAYNDVVAIVSLIAHNGSIDKCMEMVPVLGSVVMRHILCASTGIKPKAKYIYDHSNADTFLQLSKLSTDDYMQSHSLTENI